MTRLLASLLAVTLLAGQVALPSAHELAVARAEAGHHLYAGGSARVTPTDAHAHHNEADCRLCLGLSLSRLTAAAPRSPAPRVTCADVVASSHAQASPALLASAPTRGPPAAQA